MEYKNFKIITSRDDIKKLADHCKETKYCSFDFETSGVGFQYEDGYPTILGVSFQPGSAYIIPLKHAESPFNECWEEILQDFSDWVLKDPDIVKIAFNLKFEHKWFFKYFSDIKGRIFDVMLMKYLLDENRPNDLKSLVKRLMPDFTEYEDEAHTLAKKYGWANIPLEPLSQYCALDCDLTLRLCIYLEPVLIELDFYKLFRNLLMMCHRFYAEAEFNGMLINKPYLENLQEIFGDYLDDLKEALLANKTVKKYEAAAFKDHKAKLLNEVNEELEELRSELEESIIEGDERKTKSINRKISSREAKVSRYIAGEFTTKKEKWDGFNFSSPKQLIELMYTHPKGFKADIIDYSDSGNPSTGEEALIKVKAEMKRKGRDKVVQFIDNLFDYRGKSKLFTTYINGMLEKVTHRGTVNGRFLIHGTVTGRTSSQEPNLQNIPRSTTSSVIKDMFIPPPGYLVLEVDYSQAELRVVAELAKEKTMIEWFAKNYNIHVATACHANGCIDRYDEIKNTILKDENHPDNFFWEKQKKKAKLINFGILYGQTKWKLAESLECTPDEAQEFLDRWFSDFPKIKTYIAKQHKFAEKNGYVRSMWGRKRRLPDAMLDKRDPATRGYQAKALRDSVNAPIQGASNDFTLFSSVIIREEKIKGNIPWDIQFVASVHDALIFYIQPKDVHEIIPIMKKICNNPDTKEWFGFEMKYVNMKVSAELGKTWGTKKDYDENIDYREWLKAEDYPHHPAYLDNPINI